MKERYSDTYVSYQSKYRDENGYLTTKADVSVNNHIPMNSVSSGHPVLKNLRESVKEVRLQMKKAAGLIIDKQDEVSLEQSGPVLVKKKTPPKK